MELPPPRRASSAAGRQENHHVGPGGWPSQALRETHVTVESRECAVVVSSATADRTDKKPAGNAVVSADPSLPDRQPSAKHVFESKREARRRRQNLKESGDFLGVQGVNPETGEMDVLTPTTSSDSTKPPSSGLSPSLGGLAQVVTETKQAYREAKRQHTVELERAQSRREQEKMDKLEKGKEAIRTEQRKVRWRKEASQWSSVAEPDLSPVAQSQRSGGTTCRLPRKTSAVRSLSCLLTPLSSFRQAQATAPPAARRACRAPRRFLGANPAIALQSSYCAVDIGGRRGP